MVELEEIIRRGIHMDPLYHKINSRNGNTKKKAIDTVKEKYENGISLGRLREENPKLAEKIEKEGSEGQLQYARSGNKWCVLKLKKTISGESKYKNALDAVRDLYPPGIKMAELRKKNPSLLTQLKREGNLSKIPHTNKGYRKKEEYTL